MCMRHLGAKVDASHASFDLSYDGGTNLTKVSFPLEWTPPGSQGGDPPVLHLDWRVFSCGIRGIRASGINNRVLLITRCKKTRSGSTSRGPVSSDT